MSARSLRILFLSIEYPPETPDGIGTYVKEIAPALARRGHEVHVLSCLPGQEPGDRRDGEVWIHRRGEPDARHLRRVVRGKRTATRLRHALECRRQARRLGVDFDVVETPDWLAEGLLFALTRAPLVAQLHTPLEITARYGTMSAPRDIRAAAWLERVTVERASIVSSPSRLLRSLLGESGWSRAGAAEVVRYPLDADRWAPAGDAAATDPVVAYAGRLEPLKAPEVLVEAAALLRPRVRGVGALLAGRSAASRDGKPYDEWLAARIAELGAPCRLLGQLPRDELAALHARSRVLAIPSRYENLPFAGLEALAGGRPVVCTSNTGLAELLEGSGAGAVVPPGDAGALADALEPYLADPAAAAEAGRRARELVREHCSPDRIAAERERLYLEVASGRRR